MTEVKAEYCKGWYFQHFRYHRRSRGPSKAGVAFILASNSSDKNIVATSGMHRSKDFVVTKRLQWRHCFLFSLVGPYHSCALLAK